MKPLIIARHVIGYFIGISFFLLLVPYVIFTLSQSHIIHGIPLLSHFPLNPVFRYTITLIIGVIGLIFMLWSNVALLVQGEGGPTDAFNYAISPRTKHLVIKGPYRYTRNPMVFGAFSFYFVLSLYWDSPAAMLILIACFFAVRNYLQATEENRLLKDFGQEYEEYRGKVALIIPRPMKKNSGARRRKTE
jgi:protein-S-isoprenylcysteine O-methyltransferase Ste14